MPRKRVPRPEVLGQYYDKEHTYLLIHHEGKKYLIDICSCKTTMADETIYRALCEQYPTMTAIRELVFVEDQFIPPAVLKCARAIPAMKSLQRIKAKNTEIKRQQAEKIKVLPKVLEVLSNLAGTWRRYADAKKLADYYGLPRDTVKKIAERSYTQENAMEAVKDLADTWRRYDDAEFLVECFSLPPTTVRDLVKKQIRPPEMPLPFDRKK